MGLTGPIGVALDAICELPPFAVVLLGWLLTPGMMFLIGIVCEKRILPIWNGQSRAFMPGDLFLGPTLGLAVAQVPLLPKAGWWQSWLWPYAIVVLSIIAIMFQRLVGDAPAYAKVEGATANSPTKWYHDLMLYGVLGISMAVIALPVLVMAPWNTWQKYAMLATFAVWASCLVYDGIHPERMVRQWMHPASWRYRTWADLRDDLFCKKAYPNGDMAKE